MESHKLRLPSDRSRLTQDLEFVQMLANVEYLIWLAKSNYFTNEAFGNYLQYLSYLDNSQYSHLMLYPIGLSALKLIQDERTRKAIHDDPETARLIIAEQLYCSWAHNPEIRTL